MAVSQDGTLLKYVRKQTPKVCKCALMQDRGAIIYIKNI